LRSTRSICAVAASMSDFFLVCAAFNGSSATWSQCARDEVVSFELLETQSWTCPDGAPSASALPAHAGIAGALPAGVAAAEVRVPFPRGAATFVRSGSGRIEPTATPAAPAITNTVILRTTNPAQLMPASDSAARDFKDRSKGLTNNYGISLHDQNCLDRKKDPPKPAAEKGWTCCPLPDASRPTPAGQDTESPTIRPLTKPARRRHPLTANRRAIATTVAVTKNQR